MSDRTLSGRTIIMSGGSRGIGLAIALRAARDGANVALLAKTATPHSSLSGTAFTAAEDIEAAGGKALPIVGDVRNDDDVARAVAEAVEAFGGIDIVVNNASAIDMSDVETASMKRYDLMQDINCRGTFLLTKASLPYLRKSAGGHILTLSPPLNLNANWFGFLGYTIAKYGMSMTTIGFAQQFAEAGIAANSLWPRTVIQTAAAQVMGGDLIAAASRRPEIMADAAHAILTRDPRSCTGNFFIDEDVLRAEGVTDFAPYRLCEREEDLVLDLFLDPEPA